MTEDDRTAPEAQPAPDPPPRRPGAPPPRADTPRNRPMRRIMGNLPLLVLFLLSLAQAWWMSRPDAGIIHSNDFKHLYAGTQALLDGRSPYDPRVLEFTARGAGIQGGINPYVYLPTTALFLAPLTLLKFPAAVVAWFWFNWMLAWAVVIFGPRWMYVDRTRMARLAGAVFLTASMPFYRQMTAGQMNVVTAALLVVAAGAMMRRHRWLVGLCLASAFAWKIAPLALILALLPMRRFQSFGWACVFSVVIFAISYLCFDWPVHEAGFAVMREMGYGQSTWAQFGMDYFRDPFNQSVNSLLHHLLTYNPYTTPWIGFEPYVANGLTLGVSVGMLLLWLFEALNTRNKDLPAVMLAASLLMLLLPSLMWDHYCVIALPALLWVFGEKRTSDHPPRAALALIILALMTIAWRHTQYNHGLAIPLMSLRLYPMLLLFVWMTLDYPQTSAGRESHAGRWLIKTFAWLEKHP